MIQFNQQRVPILLNTLYVDQVKEHRGRKRTHPATRHHLSQKEQPRVIILGRGLLKRYHREVKLFRCFNVSVVDQFVYRKFAVTVEEGTSR